MPRTAFPNHTSDVYAGSGHSPSPLRSCHHALSHQATQTPSQQELDYHKSLCQPTKGFSISWRTKTNQESHDRAVHVITCLGVVFFVSLVTPWTDTALADTWRVMLKDGTAQHIEADKMTETVDDYHWHKGSTITSKSKSSIENLQLISRTTPKRDAATPTSSHPTGQALPEEDRPMPRSGSVFTDDDVTSYKRYGQPLYTKKKKADETQRYSDAIALLKREQYEEAIDKLHGLYQGDSEVLFNYANAQAWLRKFGNPDIAASYLHKIDSSYNGLFSKEISEFRKKIYDKNFTKQFVKYQTKLATDKQPAVESQLTHGFTDWGFSCYTLGYKWGHCATRTILKLPCHPGTDFVMPVRCRHNKETDFGQLEGMKDAYRGRYKD